MKKLVNIVAVLLGFCFLFLAFFYWMTRANALPSWLPGYDPTLAAVHVKHGVASFVVSLALFIFAWFNSAKKAS